MLATAALLMSLFPGFAAAVGAAGPASGDGIVPQALAGNQNCRGSDGDFELRINAPGDGTFTHLATGFSITIDVRDTALGQVFDYVATGGTIFKIYVKAGPDTNLYDYGAAGSDGADTGLHGTVNPSNGRFYGLSHISICFDDTASPTLVTTPNPTSGTVGETALNDSALLSGGNNPTGSITFNLYAPSAPTCTGTPAFTQTVTVAGNGTYSTSGGPTANAAGTWRWTATYSGDANNAPASSGCDAELVTIAKDSPTLVTTPNPTTGTVNVTALNDSAELSGGFNPTGSITFNLFAPSDSTCSGVPAFTQTVTVSGNGTYSTSGGPIANAVGTWRWTASYTGDTNNNTASSGCTAELVTIGLNQPSLSTAPNVLPNDSATLGGLVSPSGGTITFDLYLNATCTGDAAGSWNSPVNANGTFNSANTAIRVTADTVVSWIVTYSGDSNNAGATSGCAAEQADIDFTPLQSAS